MAFYQIQMSDVNKWLLLSMRPILKEFLSRVNNVVYTPTLGSRSKDRDGNTRSCFLSTNSLCGHWSTFHGCGCYPWVDIYLAVESLVLFSQSEVGGIKGIATNAFKPGQIFFIFYLGEEYHQSFKYLSPNSSRLGLIQVEQIEGLTTKVYRIIKYWNNYLRDISNNTDFCSLYGILYCIWNFSF